MKHQSEIKKILSGGIGIIPTDTIYGIVCSAFNPDSVEKIYSLKKRDGKKPLIVLISSIEDIRKFGIQPNESAKKAFDKYWPGPVSIILPCKNKTFFYLHRGSNSIAFRLPEPKWLINFIKDTGPIVAPSANLEGQRPAKNIPEAKGYFGDEVDFYIDQGELNNPPSKLISLSDGVENHMR
ncbi:MAG: L-threonylcarbamoyladenylate synthase [Candidatus Colwellbacteria bacterium]